MIMVIDAPADDYSVIAAAARQLHPTMRATFATRVHAALQDICEPGPGDGDRVAREALKGIWEPVDTAPPRWSRRRSSGKAA
jgi:hypothetical protein